MQPWLHRILVAARAAAVMHDPGIEDADSVSVWTA